MFSCVSKVSKANEQDQKINFLPNNEFQKELLNLIYKLPYLEQEKFEPKLANVTNEDQKRELELSIMLKIRILQIQDYKNETIEKIKKLTNLTEDYKTKFLETISESLSKQTISDTLSKAIYLNQKLALRYPDPKPIMQYHDLESVKPINKEFQKWGSSFFTPLIKLNKTSYLEDSKNVLPIAPFNNNLSKSNLMYQLTVYSFADGNNDGIGDFIGLTENLDYFAKLGVDTLYLSPAFPSSSYHGYDVIDYTDIAPELGGMDAFDNFLTKAHSLGIRVIMDVPFNHTSYEHPWFQKALAGDLKYQNYYHFYDVYSDQRENNTEQRDDPWLRGLYNHVNSSRPLFHKAWTAKFWAGMPDLNLDNLEVRKEIDAIHKFWATKGVDGFRYDAFYHIYDNYNSHKQGENQTFPIKTQKLMNEWRMKANQGILKRKEAQISSSDDEFLMFGEWWGNPLSGFKYFDYLGQKALGSVIDGEHYKQKNNVNQFGQKYQEVFILPKDEENLIKSLNEKHSNWMPFLDNHDVERWINEVKWNVIQTPVTNQANVLTNNEIDAMNYALVSLLSRGGLPILYDGNELYMQGGPQHGEGNGDYNIREAFKWDDSSKQVYFFEAKSGDLIAKRASEGMPSVEKMINDETSGFNLVSKLAVIRKNFPAVREQKVSYIVDPLDLFENLDSFQSRKITVRNNLDGSYLVYFYGYKQTGGLGNLVLKPNYQIEKILLNHNLSLSGQKISNNSDGFYGVFLIKGK
ncbi:alpha-amylase family glycosyl hydrolase [Mycoplasmopsis gallopavonis]|nr:alpha-amylase family glycosyl hydrolase [Mycoplasmopsis gallopavonis]